jgi:hypothetical protein
MICGRKTAGDFKVTRNCKCRIKTLLSQGGLTDGRNNRHSEEYSNMKQLLNISKC